MLAKPPGRTVNVQSGRTARVLIADDHAVVRTGLKQFLVEDPRIEAVGEAATGRETLEHLRAAQWDLVILDIGMPDRNGLDILQQIRASHSDTRVLVLSGYPERQYALNVLRAGAMGFIDKSAPPDELLRAVHSVLQGRRYVSATLAELLVGELDGDVDKPLHARLSEREFQVFFKLAAGQSVSEIANELCLSVKTVSTYRTRILEKMNLQTNADLTSYALRNNLIH
jgi:two-component system, NarL family, invasion response regulator UvrY